MFLFQGPLDEVFKTEKICAACIDTNHLVLGSESGMIYIVNFAGQIIKSIKSHTKAVNDISVDNSIGLTIVRYAAFSVTFCVVLIVFQLFGFWNCRNALA